MKKERALGLFKGPEKYNCTQAVLKTFQAETGMSDSSILRAKATGGGRAHQGVCGALHAARILLEQGPELDGVERDFSAQAGSLQCKPIKKHKRASCRDCVGLVAELLEPHFTTSRVNDARYIAGREERERTLLDAPSWYRRLARSA